MYPLSLVLLAALAVSGCVTTSNSLSPEQVASFRLAAVNVGFAPDARISWADGERAYAASKRVAALNPEMLANSPEAQAFIRSTVASKVKGAMQERLAGQLGGSRRSAPKSPSSSSRRLLSCNASLSAAATS
jgi:hypothetical protein